VETSTDILQGTKSNGCPLKTTSFPYKCEERQRQWHGRCSICPTAKDKEQTGSVASVQNGYARTTLSRQTIQNLTIARNNHNTNSFTHTFVLNYILLSTKFFLSISFDIVASEMKNLNKSNL